MTKKPSSNQLDAQLLKRVLAEAAPYKSLLLSTTLMAILLAPLATIRPWLVQKMVDEHIVYSDVEGLLKKLGINVEALLKKSNVSIDKENPLAIGTVKEE